MKNNNIKYFYSYEKNWFYDNYWIKAPWNIQKILSDSEIKKWIEKAKTYINITEKLWK